VGPVSLTPPVQKRPPLPPQFSLPTPPGERTTVFKPPAKPPPPNNSSSDDDDIDGDDYELFDIEDKNIPLPHPSDGVTLLQFINSNKENFPLAFEVSLGYSAHCEEVSISEGERFIANFLKRSKILTIEDEKKELYSLPLNTSFQFALLYDPNENKREALTGFLFKTAGDLMLNRTLPKVIRARKGFRGISPESSVTANELLYLKEVVQKEGNRRYVKCIQASTGKEKQLHEECLGEFSTSPHDIREYLPNLLKHFQLPLRAVMCLGIDNEEDIPSHLVSAVVTVTSIRTEESLIATSITDDSDDLTYTVPDDSNIVLNDIPLTYDVNVNQLMATPLTAEKALQQAKDVFENFNPLGVFPYLASQSTAQLSLMKSVRKEDNMDGIELIENRNIRNAREIEQKFEGTSAESIAEMTRMSGRLSVVEGRFNDVDQKMVQVEKRVDQISHNLKEQVAFLKDEVSKIRLELRKLMDGKKNSSNNKLSPPSASDDVANSNRAYLATLGSEQICDLLSVMNLNQYVDTFRNEQVSGELLMELTDDVLEQDLNVSNKLHRLRIGKLINGLHSAEGYLNGEGPYVQCVKK
jgi:hypothetical protein